MVTSIDWKTLHYGNFKVVIVDSYDGEIVKTRPLISHKKCFLMPVLLRPSVFPVNAEICKCSQILILK